MKTKQKLNGNTTNSIDKINALLDQWVIELNLMFKDEDYRELMDSVRQRNYRASRFRNTVFQFPERKIGLRSESTIGLELKYTTSDHIFSRNRSGLVLLQHGMRYCGVSRKWLVEFLKKVTQVVIVLPEENSLLRTMQKTNDFNKPFDPYKDLGIKLKKDPNLKSEAWDYI